MVPLLYKSEWQFLKKLNRITHNTAISLAGALKKVRSIRGICIAIFMAALSTE
jgi:hypothetical protein